VKDNMAFVIDKEELKPGLILFRRSDVQHRNWYCRIKLPKADRYKTWSLKTSDLHLARERAYDHEADVRFRLKHDVPVFNRPFRQVAQEYLAEQQARADRGEISAQRPKTLRTVIEGPLEDYVGSTQVHIVGDESWTGYPAWRRVNGAGRHLRNGSRVVTEEIAEKLCTKDRAALKKALATQGIRHSAALTKERTRRGDAPVPFISDSTIRFEMSIFGAVMNFAMKKRYAPVSQRFENRPKLKIMRRDEFTLDEYRKLHATGRSWVAKATTATSRWYRTMTYNFILIMCNTGMRPSEAKNLRWRDIMPAQDRDGRDIVVLFVQGKGKSRKLVAPKSVGDYLERIRAIAKATGLDDFVFTTTTGERAKTLYKNLIEDVLTEAALRFGHSGVPRSTYCFRHTYATFRLAEGVDVYFLAEQMGTSVKMIEDHYGHVDTIRHADRVLQGMTGWDPSSPDTAEAKAKASKGAATRDKAARPAPASTKRRPSGAKGQRDGQR
jgi:integrase